MNKNRTVNKKLYFKHLHIETYSHSCYFSPLRDQPVAALLQAVRSDDVVIFIGSLLLLPDYKPTPSSGLIGSGCMCVAVGVKVQIGTEKR